MDAQVAKKLAKGLQAYNRKGKALGESSKRAKVGTPSSTTPTAAVAVPKVAKGNEVIPTIKVGTMDGGSMALTSPSPPAKDQALHPPIKKDKGRENKRKKKVVVKMFCKACLGKSSNHSKALGEDPFSNPELVEDLTDKFAMLEVVHQMANLDHT
ncbi:hypothetical protein COCNU_scaffold013242G000010 [Cocos nucifera]|nr:hypothetical protein [Cocos nucifera]